MRSGLIVLVSGAVLLAAAGCTPRLQGVEGFVSSTTPVDYKADREKPDAWKGDPGADGGIADSSGGTKPSTTYGKGAKLDSSEPIDVKMNQPAKGTGQNAGEYPSYADPSYGNSNAPFAQPRPGSAGPAGTVR